MTGADGMNPVRRRPPETTLSWAAKAVSPGARVVGWRRFTGGIASSVHRLSVEERDGRVRHFVLKRWVVGDGVTGEAGTQMDREAAALVALEGSGLAVPRLVAASSGADTDGCPALLMTRVPGRVWLDPAKPDDWLSQLAITLVNIHQLQVSMPSIEPWKPKRTDWVPADARRPQVWREAWELLREPAPRGRRLIHGDYQHFNVMWTRGRLSAVIDWAWSGLGHPDRDLGHCRLNLAALYTAERAEQFKSIYEAVAGRKVEPWWDIYEILFYSPDWPNFLPIQVDRRVPVPAGMTARVETLLAAVLTR